MRNSIFLLCLVVSGIDSYSQSGIEFYESGLEKARQENYFEAIKYYNKVIEQDTLLVEAHYARGHAKKGLEDFRGAIMDFTIAIEMEDPPTTLYSLHQMYRARGNASRQLKDYLGAIRDYSKSIEFYPGYADAYFDRENTRLMIKDGKGSLADYNMVIELEPKSFDAYYHRGLLKIMIFKQKMKAA